MPDDRTVDTLLDGVVLRAGRDYAVSPLPRFVSPGHPDKYGTVGRMST